MKDYAKIVGQSPMSSRPEVRSSYRRPQAVAPKKQSSSKTGLWVFVALIILVVLFSAYRQHAHRLAFLTQDHDEKPTQTNQVAAPQYDFYSVLPSGNNPSSASTSTASPPPAASVSASSAVTASTGASATSSVAAATPAATPAVTQAPPATPVPTPKTTGAVKYYLSAGSYANSDDANQMLSQLLLVGVDATVVTTQDNGEPAYQVLVGPFSSVAAYSPVKQQLAAHQVQVSVVQQ
ncbi:MAG: SPOR domain-containing protein [Gammaproteobacteria bacterium]|nr:SPOR domain-containing protein [Gammaproteobacteria bacterium]